MTEEQADKAEQIGALLDSPDLATHWKVSSSRGFSIRSQSPSVWPNFETPS